MKNFLRNHSKTLWQAGLLLVIASLSSITGKWLGFISALLGGICWMIPNLYFRLRMQKLTSVFNIQKMLKWFFINQVLKLASSFSMIILILLLFTVDKKSFLIGYAVMIFISFPMLISKVTPRNTNAFGSRVRNE